MTMRALLPAAVFAALLVASPALAQDPKEEPREEPVPTLTTDDVVPVQVAPPDEGQKAGTPAADEGMTPEERADAEASMKAAAGQGQPDVGAKPDKKVSQEELDWRSDYAAAEEAARAAERRAIDAELRVNDLKNALGTTSTAAGANAAAAALEAQGNEVRQARVEAAAARAQADRLKSVGARQKFRTEAGPAPVTKDGEVNPAYFLQAVQKASTDLADADRRIEAYQNRIVEMRGEILRTTGSGDNFAVARIQEQITQAEADLARAQTERSAASAALDKAQNEARSAGIRLP
ncbi:MAG: hypothetical protein IPF53_08645 [Blastocatellia bacterium]|nr:hypothetical protein [Blastocatellia bacterium]MBK6427297.1 hypothetical protein [Blastocatellia bacterium]